MRRWARTWQRGAGGVERTHAAPQRVPSPAWCAAARIAAASATSGPGRPLRLPRAGTRDSRESPPGHPDRVGGACRGAALFPIEAVLPADGREPQPPPASAHRGRPHRRVARCAGQAKADIVPVDRERPGAVSTVHRRSRTGGCRCVQGTGRCDGSPAAPAGVISRAAANPRRGRFASCKVFQALRKMSARSLSNGGSAEGNAGGSGGAACRVRCGRTCACKPFLSQPEMRSTDGHQEIPVPPGSR